MRRIKAFTLLETTLAMVVVGIVLLAGSSALEIIYEQAHQFATQLERQSTLYRLDRIMTWDVSRADWLQIDTGGILIRQTHQEVRYVLDTGFIARQDPEHTDTFHLKVQNWQGSYQGDTTSMVGEPIDQFILRLESRPRQRQRLEFSCWYAAREQINVLNDAH